jgi:hypothetical protein
MPLGGPTKAGVTSRLRKEHNMSVLADSIDTVIGVDTHRDTIAAAAVTALGTVVAGPPDGALD